MKRECKDAACRVQQMSTRVNEQTLEILRCLRVRIAQACEWITTWPGKSINNTASNRKRSKRRSASTCHRIWTAVCGQYDDDRICARFHTVLEPELFGSPDVEALICRDGELLPEAGAAELRLWFYTGVTAVYLLGHVSLIRCEALGREVDDACKQLHAMP